MAVSKCHRYITSLTINTIKSIYVAGGVSNIMNGLRKERREPNGAPLPTRGEGLGWGIIFLKNKKLHTPPLPLPFMGGELLAHEVFPF